MAVKQCDWDGCEVDAAYGTRTKPAWCDEHITSILRQGGLEPLEPFTSPTAWRLTRCLACGCEAHYRFVYTLDKNGVPEPTCRACFWRDWAQEGRNRLAGYVDPGTEEDPEEARAFAEAYGYEYLAPLTQPSLANDPHHVRCTYCKRISAERLGDIGWGCSCQVNPRRSKQTGLATRLLLKDSESAAVVWWDHERNAPDLWATATDRTRRMAWWNCPECSQGFEARIADMFSTPQCPACRDVEHAKRTEQYRNTQSTSASEHTDLMAAWADPTDPATVKVGDSVRRNFRCANGHEFRAFPAQFLDSGCSVCRGQETRASNALEREEAFEQGVQLPGLTLNPELVEQWHAKKNGKLVPSKLSPNSRKTIWWHEASCGHEWQASPAERERRQRLRCPICRTILDSLAWHFPNLAAEWSPDNPLSPWHVRPSGNLPFVPEWVCTADPKHRWQIATNVRVNGSDCPMCREQGKSRVELAYFAAIRDAFGDAVSGLAMRDQAFDRRTVWVPDMTVGLLDGRTLVVEYDGSYWHAQKMDVDRDKSIDLLAAGVLVVRLREDPLPSLDLDLPGYMELRVYSTVFEPERVVAELRAWMSR